VDSVCPPPDPCFFVKLSLGDCDWPYERGLSSLDLKGENYDYAGESTVPGELFKIEALHQEDSIITQQDIMDLKGGRDPRGQIIDADETNPPLREPPGGFCPETGKLVEGRIPVLTKTQSPSLIFVDWLLSVSSRSFAVIS